MKKNFLHKKLALAVGFLGIPGALMLIALTAIL